MTVAELQNNFSAALKEVELGEKIGITDGKNREVKAMLVPNEEKKGERKLGLLKGIATAEFIGGHNTTEEEFYGL